MSNPFDEHDPFSDWSKLLNRPVYSEDDKKIGYLRKIVADYMVVKKGFITLNKYFIPQSLAKSIDRKGKIKLEINAFEVRSKYSHAKVKNTLIAVESIPESHVEHRPLHDRLQTLGYGATRNRLAATMAFVSGLLFLASGYRANLEIYELVVQELSIHTPKELWTFVILPIGFLALLSQLGGITVLVGAGLFAANRVNLGKFLVTIGTGQGLLTIALRLLSEIANGRLGLLDNNYVLWLTSSATGLGILFALFSQSLSKGSGRSVYSRVSRFLRRKRD